jgi:hypothetical protein
MYTLKQLITIVVLFLTALQCTYAQSGLWLKSAMLTNDAVDAISQEATRKSNWQDYTYNGQLYLILQFDHIPTASERSALELLGIHLMEYLPDYAYLASIESWQNIQQARARAVLPLLPSFKVSPSLSAQLTGRKKASLQARPIPMPGVGTEALLADLQQEGYQIHRSEWGNTIHLSEEELTELAAHPAVRWIEPAPEVPFTEGTSANASMRSNWLTQGPGDGYDGTGVVIGIADDGDVDHTDLKNRLLLPPSLNWGNHGDMTTGIAAGAGNINPRAVGLSPGAVIHLTMISGYLHITNAVDRYNSLNVTVTSTSYGEGCGGYYNSNAQFIDAQLADNAPLMHIFSAGNKGSSSCNNTYGQVQGAGGIRYGGITGGYKAAKNVIAVGNATFGDILVASSSRGPSEDGRIKPDICAIGQGSLTTSDNDTYRYGSGTSAAAPAVAGIWANLTQAYRLLYGIDPPSALMKACLLNGARDIGRPGPDYDTGWGLVDGKNALEMLQMNQYATSSVNNNGQRNHIVQVPVGAKNLKIMLYWHDKAGSPLSYKALVNDLDLRVITPTNTVKKPWSLSTYPHIDSLTMPATPGTDRVNNVEQVKIANPVPGTYSVQVLGHEIPQGPQSYYVVYHWETTPLQLAYPIGNERLVPGELEYISWDAVSSNGSFDIQFSTNGGASWQNIATNIAGHLRQQAWTVPDIASRQCKIRVKQSGQLSSSSGNFNILETPIFHITSAGQQTAQVSWEPVSGANQYEVFALGGEYMESLGMTSNTSMLVPATIGTGNWYSVRARNTNGTEGRRAYGLFYEHYNCEEQITFKLTMDAAPYQVSWQIADPSGHIFANGGPYNSNAAFLQLDIPVCLPEGCYTLTINDSGNNGLCCQLGQGGYQLISGSGLMLASGSSFGSSSTHNFCLEQTAPPLQVNMYSSPQTSCFGVEDAIAIAYPSGGTPPYSYNWSNGANSQQASSLGGGIYTVTITDQSGNQIQSQVFIEEPAPLSVDIFTADNPCGEVADGEATASVAGGTPPYSYQWSNGSNQSFISLVEPGYYQLTVTDANGCTSIAGAQVYSTSNIELYLYGNTPSCHEDTDGSVIAYITGNNGSLSFQWSNGSTQNQLLNVGSGLYSVTVTDQSGCTGDAAILLEAPDELHVVTSLGTDGTSVSLVTSGGTPPYSYLWSHGAQQPNLQNLEGGVYFATITDAEGCTATTSVQIIAQTDDPCESYSENSTYNWIEEVSFGSSSSQTGNNGGYLDLSGSSAFQQEMMAGQSYPITLKPGFLYNSFNLYWRVYADLNEDGDFEDSNELLFASPSTPGIVEGSITIPPGASFGAKTLRISMAFGNPPAPCEIIHYGEVEDYRFILADDTEYCISEGSSTSQEWIEHVKIGSHDYTSGNNDGYGDFSGTIIPIERGQQTFFNLVPGYAGTAYPENWSVWIDYNGNGIFSPNNELVAEAFNHVGPLSGSFTIPANAPLGQVRARIVMRWDPITNACDSYAWGETEDYSLLIVEGDNLDDGDFMFHNTDQEPTTPPTDLLKLWPNPSQGQINLQYELLKPETVTIRILTPQGQVLLENQAFQEAGKHIWATELKELADGAYFLILRSEGKYRRLPFIIQR